MTNRQKTMTNAVKSAAAVILFSVALSGCSKQSPVVADATEKADDGKLENIISIDFSKKAYTYTLAEVAKGIQFDYTITVGKVIDGVMPIPQDDGSASGPGPSGLFPFEKISGNSQSYSLRDIGLAPPHETPARTIKQGKYRSSFEWDGRNWTGPSDFDNPKGDPFPPGNYKLEVRIVGDVESPKGRVRYEISKSVPVKLLP